MEWTLYEDRHALELWHKLLVQESEIVGKDVLGPWPFPSDGLDLAELPVHMDGADEAESVGKSYGLEILEAVVLEEDKGVGGIEELDNFRVATPWAISVVLHG